MLPPGCDFLLGTCPNTGIGGVAGETKATFYGSGILLRDGSKKVFYFFLTWLLNKQHSLLLYVTGVFYKGPQSQWCFPQTQPAGCICYKDTHAIVAAEKLDAAVHFRI